MHSAHDLRRWLGRKLLTHSVLKVIFVSTFLTFLAYTPLFIGQTIYFGDNFSLIIPGKLFTTEWIAQGVLPFWNPLLLGGIPWIGDINQSILYPSTVVFLLLSAGHATSLTVIMQIILSLSGMVFLSKALGMKDWQGYLAGILWTFSPQITESVNNLATVQSITWFPWVVLTSLMIGRWRGLVFFSIVVFAQLAGGYPLHVFYAVLTAVVVSIWQQRLRISRIDLAEWLHWLSSWIRAGITVLLVTAVLWLPFLPVLAESTRTIQSAEQAASGSLKLAEVLKIFLPAIFDSPAAGMRWGVSWQNQPNLFLYFTWFGLLTIFCAIVQKKFQRRDNWLVGLMIVALVVAFGDTLPTFTLTQYIPILNSARGASIILMIPAFVISLMVARFAAEIRVRKTLYRLVLGGGVSLLIVSALTAFLINSSYEPLWNAADRLTGNKLSQSVFHTPERDQVILQAIATSLLIMSGSLILSVLFWKRKRYSILAIVLTIDMACATQGHVFDAPGDIYDQDDNLARTIQSQADTTQYRLLTRNYNSPYTDFGAYFDATSVRQPFSDSYVDDTELTSLDHLRRMRDGLTPGWQVAAGIPTIHGYTTLLPTDMHEQFAPSEDASINRLPQIMIDNPLLSHWSVRYYVVDTWFPDYDEKMPETVLFVQEPWVVYELPNILPRFRTKNNAPVEIISISENPNRIAARLIVPDDSGLLIADRYDRDWMLTVNGERLELQEFAHLRLIALEEGTHDILLEYHPRWFYRGAIISAVTLLLLVVVVWLERSQKLPISTQDR